MTTSPNPTIQDSQQVQIDTRQLLVSDIHRIHDLQLAK